MKIKNVKFSVLAITSLTLLLGGCNTIEGAGVDIQKAGKSIENSAERHKGSSHTCTNCR